MFLIYIPCPNKKSAKKIALHLLDKKLIGCANIIPEVESLYPWPTGYKKKIVNDKETILIAKTIGSKFGQIKKEIIKIHPYKLPAIIGFKVQKINPKYLNWIKGEIK